jgi:putative transposase
VCAELANRGIKDVLIVCCDGLTGFPEAIEATWPNSTIQTCVVHLIRAAMRFVNWHDRRAVAAALKPIYQAADADAARIELEAFQASELGRKSPTPSPRSTTRGSVSHRSWRSRRCCAGSSIPGLRN